MKNIFIYDLNVTKKNAILIYENNWIHCKYMLLN